MFAPVLTFANPTNRLLDKDHGLVFQQRRCDVTPAAMMQYTTATYLPVPVRERHIISMGSVAWLCLRFSSMRSLLCRVV